MLSDLLGPAALAGFDEMDEVNGAGSAELDDDGTLEIESSFHLGDDAVLKARRP